MLAVRKINNNVVVCKDRNDRELIALGKGIGFGELPREISPGEVERTFYDVDDRYYQLAQELPSEILSFTGKIVDIARNELACELSPNLVMTLADHLTFAMERARKQMRIRMPLAYDIEQMYPEEYRIGKYTVRRILKEFRISLPEEEAAGVAMNLINGRVTPEENSREDVRIQDEEMLDDITEIVEGCFQFIVDRESFNYSRYATHLQYLFQRIHAREEISSSNLQIYGNLKEEFPQITDCVEEIAAHIREKWDCGLSEEEKLYLILHVNRICIREGL